MKLAGRTCLITGASRGLGQQIAVAFWRQGASLMLIGRKLPDLQQSQELLGGKVRDAQRVELLVCDLAKAGQIAALIEAVQKTFRSISVLVNNAAVLGPIGTLTTNDLDAWEHAIRVNLFVPCALCARVIPMMQQAGYGKIINLSGGGASGPRPNFSSYAAAKAALVRFSETLSEELAPHRIDVNCIAPGILDTDMTHTVLKVGPDLAGKSEFTKAHQCIGNRDGFGRAVDLAVFLASAESDGITGRLISAVFDPWPSLALHRQDLRRSDIYTLRRIMPKDRGMDW